MKKWDDVGQAWNIWQRMFVLVFDWKNNELIYSDGASGRGYVK